MLGFGIPDEQHARPLLDDASQMNRDVSSEVCKA